MKILAIFLILFLTSCWNRGADLQNSLSGKTLIGTITSSDGVFYGLEGYQFITKFTATGFVTQNSKGIIESRGYYVYDENKIVLHSIYGIHPGENLEIKLKFIEKNNGIYEACHLSAIHHTSTIYGKQGGIFNLR